MTLPACALFTPRQAEIELQLLPPADLEQEVLLKQKLTFVSDGREQRFLAVVRLERERVRMLVLTAAGRQLLALDYDGETLSQDNRVRLEPLPPTRGLIYDANGVLLANNYPSYSLEITLEKVADLDATIAELGDGGV